MLNLSITATELREHRSWFTGWLLSILAFTLMIVLIYPGDEAMRELLELFSDPLYEAFLGQIGGENPSYRLWQSMMGGFLGLIFAIFGILSGVRLAMKGITDDTSEIVSTYPSSRTEFLLSRTLSIVIYGALLVLGWFVPTLIPINGNYLEFDVVLTLMGWAFIFLLAMIAMGVFLGNVIGSSGRGAQNSILLVLAMFVMQVVVSLQSENLSKTEFWEYEKTETIAGLGEVTSTVPYTLFDLLTDVNFVYWYNPSGYLLGTEVDMKYIWLTVIAFALFMLMSVITYNRKDLIDERGLFNFRLFRRRKSQKKSESTKENDEQSHVKPKRSVKKSIYVFWIRPLEKRLPFTADFVYSDRRAMLILAIATVLFWPMQLMAYTGDEIAEGAASFITGGGLFNVFFYGYDTSGHPPFGWWLTSQALGLHWMLLLPLVLRWIRSVPSRDGEDGTGDLIGSLPVRKRQIVYQRLFAVFLEMIWISLWFIIWYLVSVAFIESRVGSVVTAADPANGVEELLFNFNNPFDTLWVIIAVLFQIPFYMFLVSIGVLINLALKERGLTYGKAIIYVLVLMFVIGFSIGNPGLYWITGIFGMYNPIYIAFEQSIDVANYGILIITALAVVSLFAIKFFTKNFSWLRQDVKEFYDQD